MDYSLLTEQQLQKRYYSLSQKIRDVLDSENNLESIRQICRIHHLNDNEKILIVEQLVGLILLGFVPVNDFSREISENIYLNKQHADDIAADINRKIFLLIRSDLEKVYSPVSEGEAEAEESRDEIVSSSIPVEIRKSEPPIKIVGMDAEPMIIHEETEFKPLSESKKSLKPLGGLFEFLSASRRKKEEPEEANPVRAEVEGIVEPEIENKELRIKDIKPIETKIKVVNYTEAPIKIVGIEEETQPAKGPIIVSEEAELKPFSETKKSSKILSRLFGLLKKKEAKKDISAPKEEPPIKIVGIKEEIQSKEVQLPKVEIKIETEQKPKRFLSKISGFFKKTSG